MDRHQQLHTSLEIVVEKQHLFEFHPYVSQRISPDFHESSRIVLLTSTKTLNITFQSQTIDLLSLNVLLLIPIQLLRIFSIQTKNQSINREFHRISHLLHHLLLNTTNTDSSPHDLSVLFLFYNKNTHSYYLFFFTSKILIQTETKDLLVFFLFKKHEMNSLSLNVK